MILREDKLTNFKHILTTRGAVDICLINTDATYVFNFTIPNLFDFQIEARCEAEWFALPKVRIVADGHTPIPHVSNDGLICVTDQQGELFDSNRIESLFEYALDEAIRIVQSYITQPTNLYEELEGYVETTLETGYKITLLDKPNDIEEFQAITKINKGKLSVSSIQKSNSKSFILDYGTYRNITVIKLADITDFVLPNIGGNFDRDWWNSQKLKLSAKQHSKIYNNFYHITLIIVPYKDRETYIVICNDNASSIVKNNFSVYLTQRCWKDYLLARTGEDGENTRNKTVVIAGCGSVGSKVAGFLSESDISQLSLIDNDIMSPDNLMRHQLGVKSINHRKAFALKARLSSDMPFIDIKAYHIEVLKWLKMQNDDDLREIDCLILTTGHIPTEIAICEYLYYKDINIQIISGWVEAYGLGGQAYSFRNNSNGCLRCLYTDENSIISRSQAQLFNLNNQVVSKNITGCSGAFTPYSSLHATKTASIITELVLTPKYGLYTWVNTSRKPSDYNLEATEYFNIALGSGGYQFNDISSYKIAGCECCSS